MNTKLTKRNAEIIDYNEVGRVANSLDLNSKLVELLFSRGLTDEKSIKSFLQPNVENFYDPFLLKGMKEAVDRINYAIDNNEKIIVYGDYDADGICANAILSLYLSSRGLNVYSHTPNRIGEDYGLNVDTLERLIEEVIPDLIITCDCGISCHEEVDFIQDLGVDVIVTDHHEVGSIVPDCTVINPKQSDCNYPFNMLCGAGVALKVVQALGGIDEMFKYLDLCAIATVADLVPLLDENRLIVQLGLARLQSTKNIGLKALFESQKIYEPTSSDIAYKIAPRINAAGRMGDAYRAFELVTTDNKMRVAEIIKEINKDNDRRKKLCNEMYGEAVEDLALEDLINDRAIVLSHPSWEKGITGIVAAKLSGEYNRPTFIMVNSGANYKGTCRSIEGINVYEILTGCADLLNEYGGHSQAAGFTIEKENIPAFKCRVNDLLRGYDDELFAPNSVYDIDVEPKDLTYNFVNALALLEPTGNSNTKPLFKLSVENLAISPCKNNANHVSILLENKFQMFAFNYSLLSYQLLGTGRKDLIIELQHNSFGGKDVKGILRACKPSKLYINDNTTSGYELSLLKFNDDGKAKYTEYLSDEINEVFQSKLYGTMVIASNRAEYEQFVKDHKLLFNEFVYSNTKNNYTKIIVAPDFEHETFSLSNFEKIIFLSRPYNEGIISFINQKSNATVFVPKEESPFPDVSSDRMIFMTYYDAIKECVGYSFPNNFALFRYAKQYNQDINYKQFIVCLLVFEELGLVERFSNPVSVTINKAKVDLSSSGIYNFIVSKEV